MSFGQDLYGFLKDHAAVKAQVGDRIYPAVLTANVVYPAATYQDVGGAPDSTLADAPGAQERDRIQIDVYADSYGAADTARLAIAGALNGFRGVMGSVHVGACRLLTKRYMGYEPSTRVHRWSMDFRVTHEDIT